jgi:hypothetical protein
MKYFLLYILFFLRVVAIAQDIDSTAINKNTKLHRGETECGHNYIMTTGIHVGRYSSFELSFSRGYSWSSGGYPGTFNQYGIGMEFYYYNKGIEFHPNETKFVYAPKISFELDPFLPRLCLSRINLLYVTDFKNNSSLKYRHEVGLSLYGIVNLTYGYTFNLTNRNYLRLNHSINLQWNIFCGKRKYDNWT